MVSARTGRVGMLAARRSVRLQRLALHLHECGARPMFEALLAVADGQSLDVVLADFGRIPVHIYRAVGAAELHLDRPVEIRGGRQ